MESAVQRSGYELGEPTTGASPPGQVLARRTAEPPIRRTDDQLRQSQKMEALGRLASGIAHDFNNLLSIILSYTSLIFDELRPNDPIRADLEQVHSAGVRAGELTRQLLAFSRQQVLEPSIVDLSQILGRLERMLARMVGEGISLEVAASQPIGKVLADPNQIEQIILNLAVRAREAMPDGGRLTIATRDERISPEQLADHPGATPGRHVVLSMTDSGADLGEVTRGKLFDPVQAGPGLGMLTVRAIVQQNNGHIRVSGGSGRGTTIEIYLPRADLADDATPPSATLRGTETILLVEDDELVRAALRVVLQKNGYRVLEAQNGGEAIMICEEHQAGIHLLLTDVVMPRMSGREVARRLVDLQPAMKVLYMSGYTEDSILHHGLIDAGFSFLSKPITMETLLRKVRDLLGATAEMGGGVDGA